ncbi:MAG TPA: 50S ribosomal protein L6 [Gammaproteobacteria bacterium]|jgi:large subunit ribosomal protein L6|nr:50S ribosomal protein L6 [Gammaproteobacteria bacterium]
MSRVGKKPIELGKDLSAEVKGQSVTIKGKKGSLTLAVNSEIEVKVEGTLMKVAPRSGSNFANAMAGTTRAHLANMVAGVTNGFQKKLELVGVGYRAAVQGQKLNLTLGFSHPVEYPIPKGITIETPSQNEIIVKGMDRQQVGQVAANIRGYRPPEPYKGKGVKYSNERIELKEAKKK